MSAAEFVQPEEAAAAAHAAPQTNAATADTLSTATPAVAASPSAGMSVTPTPAGAPAARHYPRLSESHAATKIQASFRGHKHRKDMVNTAHSLTQGFPQTWFPHSGPWTTRNHPPPPATHRKWHRSLVLYAKATAGEDGVLMCGCPGTANDEILHFDRGGPLPQTLVGIYTAEEWKKLMQRIDDVMRGTHLPLCPAGLMCALPLLGGLCFLCWRDSLQKRRTRDLAALFDRENSRLAQWGLHWTCTPIYRVHRHGTSSTASAYVIEFRMGGAPPAPAAAAAADADGAKASGPRLVTVSAAPPRSERMDDSKLQSVQPQDHK